MRWQLTGLLLLVLPSQLVLLTVIVQLGDVSKGHSNAAAEAQLRKLLGDYKLQGEVRQLL